MNKIIEILVAFLLGISLGIKIALYFDQKKIEGLGEGG